MDHTKLWGQQLRAKYYGQGQKWQPADTWKILDGFDAVLDTPCCFFIEELMEAFPDALVILNTRPFETWHRSMKETIWKVQDWPTYRLLQYTDPRVIGTHWPNKRLEWQIFCGHDYSEDNCRRAFDLHYEHIKKVVPAEKLLVYDLGSGWAPLCNFLGKEIPTQEYPIVNDKGTFMKYAKILWWHGVKASGWNAVKIVVPLVIPILAGRYYARYL
ncbi:MAG: hypothetical protein Q9222_001846 [Ikaeria aurantiellina]